MLPKMFDGRTSSENKVIRVFNETNPSREVDLRIFRTYDTSLPDTYSNEGVWCMLNDKFLGRRRADHMVAFVGHDDPKDLTVRFVNSASEAGWARPHALQGQLL